MSQRTLAAVAGDVLGGSVLHPHPGYRTAIGVLGVSLPPVLVLFSGPLQNSISAYYHTGTRDWFVGTLWVIGVFLFFYQYRPGAPGGARSEMAVVRSGWADAVVGKVAGVSAVLVALLPTDAPEGFGVRPPEIGRAHGVAAAVLFLCLSLFPLWLFSQSRERVRVYRVCGWSMLFFLAAIVAYTFAPEGVRHRLAPWRPVLVLEWLLIWAFGISWFTKGLEGKGRTGKDRRGDVPPLGRPVG